MKIRRGVALIWVLVLSTVLLITSTTMVSYIIKESQFSVRIEESTQVYAAAKSGIDWAKWKLDSKKPLDVLAPSYAFDLLGNDGVPDTTVTIDESQKTITSASIYNNVTRKLKYKVTPTKSAALDLKDKINSNPSGKWIGTNNESFDIQFDFWGGSVPFGLGVYDSANNTNLFLDVDTSGSTRLKATAAGVTYQSDPINQLLSAQSSLFYYKAKIKYIKNTAAKLSIETFDLSTLSYSCLDETTLDLTNLSLGNLARLYVTSPSTVRYIENGDLTDGTYITIGNPGSFRYVDNLRTSFISSLPSWTVTTPPPIGKGTVTGAGIFLDGTDVTLSASNTVPGYLFNNWYSTTTGSCPINGSTSATASFIVSGNANCSANFVAAPTLTVNANNSTYGTAAGSGTYRPGTVVSISATPATGYAFSHWSGACSGIESTISHTVDGTSTCTANFYGKVPIYRFLGATEHLYTQNFSEGSGAGYTYEGIGWYAPNCSASGAIVINRFVYPGPKRYYHWTNFVAGWTLEGGAFCGFTAGGGSRAPVHQLLYKNDGIRRFWTISEAEKNALVSSGAWIYEGSPFFGYY